MGLVCVPAAQDASCRGRLRSQPGPQAKRRGRTRITVEKKSPEFQWRCGGYLKLEAAFSLTALCPCWYISFQSVCFMWWSTLLCLWAVFASLLTLVKTVSACESRYVELFTFYRRFKLFTLANLVICAMC